MAARSLGSYGRHSRKSRLQFCDDPQIAHALRCQNAADGCRIPASICIVDDAGKIVREVRVASEPEALLQVLTNTIYRFKRVWLEAGPLSQWLFSVLAEAGLPVICVETRC